MKISKGIGIDLGTTNSAVAVMDATDREIIMYKHEQRGYTTPSVVWFDPKKKEIVVGHRAASRRGSFPSPVVSIKRAMGTTQKVKLGGRDVSPEEVSAEILKELRRQIETKLKEFATSDTQYVVDRAIITIPAYFQLPQIEATRKAGELAGLEVIELLHEPTAAAVHYSYKHGLNEDCTFLVFDPGGGTFDVSILRRTAGAPEVLGISGDMFLGGDDLDRRLAELIRRRLAADEDMGYDLDLDVEHDPEDALRFAQLVMQAEGIKIKLTDNPEVLHRDTSLRDKQNQNVVIEMTLQRGEFETEVRDLVEKMIPKCWEALAKAYKKASITLKDIDYILLVGGTSYVPLVQETARLNFCRIPNPQPPSLSAVEGILAQITDEHRETARYLMSLNERARCEAPIFEDPDTCNARGAAIQAALAGMSIYNDEETVRVTFQGQGATASSKAKIAGKVEVLDTNGGGENGRRRWKPLAGGRIVVSLTESRHEDEDFLDERGGFRFKDIPLQANAVSTLNFAVYDENNHPVASVGRPMAQDKATASIGTSVGSTAVLPLPIRIQGLIRGRVGTRTLIDEGQTLPREADFTFSLGEQNAGYVVIPIFQGTTKIREIQQNVNPNLPPGTEIKFHIHIDEKALIVCKGQIGTDPEFNARIEPPQKRPPTQEEIDEKLSEFEDSLKQRRAADAAKLRAEMRPIKQDLADARQSGDEPKSIALFEDVCRVVEKAGATEPPLDPPKEDFDDLVYECLRLVKALGDMNPNFKADEAERNIRAQQEIGAKSAEEHDQQSYSEAFAMLVSYGQGIQAELQRAQGAGSGGGKPKPQQDPATQAMGGIEHFRGVCAQLRRYAETCSREMERKAESERRDAAKAQTFRRQAEVSLELMRRVEEIDGELMRMQPQAQSNPDSVLRKFHAVEVDLKRIYGQLEGFMKDAPSSGRGPGPFIDIGQ